MAKSNFPPTGLDGRVVDDLGDELEGMLLPQTAVNPESTQSPPHDNPFEKMTIHDMMVAMRRTFIEELLGRLEDGTATHQELAIIQRMLNDSGYVVDRDPTPTSGSGGPPTANRMALPDLEGHDYE